MRNIKIHNNYAESAIKTAIGFTSSVGDRKWEKLEILLAMSMTSPTGKSYGYAARTPVPLCRGTLSAVPPGGNPQDRTASPPDWLTAPRLRS
ncbi:MAG: hypothetical protein KME32_08520 [Mojavia pulchra JT2-VF2]|uniref:Uncharacterized protein n=1 Tax=Mojavia pulchra JT2-VF2 TaxID=287848 RepID=A0A951PYD9_9NOST|nr:hypothetical protein [Mojavia pulchra JT2-VF2]